MIEAEERTRLGGKRGLRAVWLLWAASGLVVAALVGGCTPSPSRTASRSTPFSAPVMTTQPASAPSIAQPTAPPATPAALPDLLPTRMNIQLETGGACNYTSTGLGVKVVIQNIGAGDAGPFAVEVNGVRQDVAGVAAGATAQLWFGGLVSAGENVAVADAAGQVSESDEGNNRLAERLPIPTLPPTCTPAAPTATTIAASTPRPTDPPASPVATPVPTTPPLPPSATPSPRPAAVTVRESTVTIPTYPYASYLSQSWNDTYGIAYATLDRDAYQAANPTPSDVIYRTLVLENSVLRLTFLPELGGRLYEVYYKPTDHRVTYRNPVLKPSPWGPAEQGWWLAAGGIEWCLPVEEHGYEWGVPWAAEITQDAGGATVTLRDTTADDRVRAAIAVRLEAEAGYFTIRPRLENPTGSALAIKYWTNAMLAPGGRNAPSSRLRFVLADAVTAVTVHSRGDDWLPGYNERLAWPVYQGVDFGRLGNWTRWLGFFEDPAAGDFMAVYDEEYDEGLVRVFPATVARGAKAFAFGWANPIAPANWTDDGSSYVEIHGGPAPTFDDTVTLPAGGHLEWTEIWYPVAGLGGLRYANAAAALQLTAQPGLVEVAIAVTRAWTGKAALLIDGAELWRDEVSLVPGQAVHRSFLPAQAYSGPVILRLTAADGSVLAEYHTALTW